MHERKRHPALFAILIAVIFAVAAIRAHSYMQESSKYIEVCRNGPVHVPPDTRFVTCNGVIRKVKGFLRGGNTPPPGDCFCPDCCGGTCWVIIACGSPEPDEDMSGASSKSKKKMKPRSQELCLLGIAC